MHIHVSRQITSCAQGRNSTYLGNRDAGTRCLADLANLASGTSNDASNHVCRNADVLRLDLLTVLIVRRRSTDGRIRIRSTIVRTRTAITEVGAISCSHYTRVTIVASARRAIPSYPTRSRSTAAKRPRTTRRCSNDWIVEDCASSTLPIINQTLADFPDSPLDALRISLDLNNSFCRLR